LSRLIIIASKAGGGDPVTNLKLRYAIDKARAISMPKDNIERAIRRGTGEAEGITYEELVYEGFGAGGTAIVVDLLTDNRNRSNGEIRKLFEKGGGNMGAPGCAAHFFDRKGVFVILAKGIDEDSLMSIVLDAGADDMQNDRGKFTVTCDPAAFQKVQEALGKNNIVCESAEITMVAKMNVDVDAETASKVTRLLETLDDNDDVQNVYCNMQMSPEVLAKLEKE
ncbi:MAG: YebC/PmpR family DNA-binding transcriptional regulator, partial [Planctomycetes bacterium]|nr:YebC/PmpR family DNA-binding transcriptional regulator [Planctomycetota bacterium]